MTQRHTPSKRKPSRRVPRRSRAPLLGGAMFIIVLLAGLIFIATRPDDSGNSAGRADPHDAAQVAQGQQVYVANCAGCHGTQGEGQANWQTPLANGSWPAPPHNASGHTWHHPDSYLFDITKRGGQAYAQPGVVSAMPGFGGSLSDAEIWAVLAYIKSLWPADIQAAQEQANQ